MSNTILRADLSQTAHAKATLQLLDTYARDIMGGGEALSAHTRDHLIDALRTRPGVHVFLAFDADKPTGLAICIEGFSTFACAPLLNIHDFAVAPAYRGRGIARGLMAAVEAHARQLGCCKITLEVLEGNTTARQLYESVGFAGYELDPAMGKAVFLQKKLT